MGSSHIFFYRYCIFYWRDALACVTDSTERATESLFAQPQLVLQLAAQLPMLMSCLPEPFLLSSSCNALPVPQLAAQLPMLMSCLPVAPNADDLLTSTLPTEQLVKYASSAAAGATASNADELLTNSPQC